MPQIVTTAQMRAIEKTAIAAGRVTGQRLMERAGEAVVAAILETWPDCAAAARRAFVLCGPGNNGGDGYVVARLLASRGWAVTVAAFGDPARLPADAKTNHDRWRAQGPVMPLPASLAHRADHEILIDAGFGIGLARPLPEPMRDIFAAQAGGRFARHAVAVDIPSGLDADTGAVLLPCDALHDPDPAARGLVCRADLTVTFHAAKPGHLQGAGPHHCGQVVVKSIGL